MGENWNSQTQEKLKNYYRDQFRTIDDYWNNLGRSFDEFATNNEIAWNQLIQSSNDELNRKDIRIHQLEQNLIQAQEQINALQLQLNKISSRFPQSQSPDQDDSKRQSEYGQRPAQHQNIGTSNNNNNRSRPPSFATTSGQNERANISTVRTSSHFSGLPQF
jgi:chromosome segregation ATPase